MTAMNDSRHNIYQSCFEPSRQGWDVLIKGRMLGADETPRHMVERLVDSLVGVEDRFETDEKEKAALANEFGHMLDEKLIVMSTPIVTNAGRFEKKPLSACTVPPLDLARDGLERIKKVVTDMHEDGMGTGFSLNDLDEPVRTLEQLNNIALESSVSGREDRPVGNMATLRVDSPRIMDFIKAKVEADQRGEIWKFNISVDCNSDFFEKLEDGGDIRLTDGSYLSARAIFDAIAEAAHICADPGLIFIDRMEADNPTPCVGHYVTTAPCAEVGLTTGESCQFGYINIAGFLSAGGAVEVDALRRVARLMTRILDNALEISIQNYTETANRTVMSQKRKIGIGICGLADLLVRLRMPYSSPEARQIALDIVTLINFESKQASYELAKTRGSFGAMSAPQGNRHIEEPSFIERRYGSLESRYVSLRDWIELAERIRSEKMLRNASTISLPPTGRSALIIDASTGVEPIFSKDAYLMIHPGLSLEEQMYIQTAKSIEPIDHLRMAAVLQKGVDESISKTINMSSETSKDDIAMIYKAAWDFGLKGVSVYREGSKNAQPVKLT